MEHFQEVMVALSESCMKKVRAAPPGGGLTMTSYPVGNKTSLSRKPYITDKKLLMERYQEVMVAMSESFI